MIFSWKKIKFLGKKRAISNQLDEYTATDSELDLASINLGPLYKKFNSADDIAIERAKNVPINEQIDQLLIHAQQNDKSTSLEKAEKKVKGLLDSYKLNGKYSFENSEYNEEEIIFNKSPNLNKEAKTSNTPIKKQLSAMLNKYFSNHVLTLTKEYILKTQDLNLINETITNWDHTFSYLEPCFKTLSNDEIRFTLGQIAGEPKLVFEIDFEEKSSNYISLFFRVLKTHIKNNRLEKFNQSISVSYKNHKLLINLKSIEVTRSKQADNKQHKKRVTKRRPERGQYA